MKKRTCHYEDKIDMRKSLVSFQQGLNSVNHLPFEYRPRNAQSFPTWARNSLETRSSNIFARKCTHTRRISTDIRMHNIVWRNAGRRQRGGHKYSGIFSLENTVEIVDTFCVYEIRGNMGMMHSKSYYLSRSFLPVLSFRSI